MSGVYNCAAPEPVTNEIFMKLLRSEMKIPFGISSPKWLLEIGAALINTETELILKSRWVLPERLTEKGYVFNHSQLEKALSDILHNKNQV